MQQLHKKFTNEQIRQLIQRYLNKEIKGKYFQSILGIKKTNFLLWSNSISRTLKPFPFNTIEPLSPAPSTS